MNADLEEALRGAVLEVMGPVFPVEDEWTQEKLEEKVVGYFKNAAKKIETRQKWEVVLREYSEKALGTIFQVFGERPWFRTVDFLPALDAGFRRSVPARVLNKLADQVLTEAIVAEYERVYEHNIRGYVIWDAAAEHTNSEEAKKKVWTGLEKAYALSSAELPDQIEEPDEVVKALHSLLEHWIHDLISRLGDSRDEYLPEDVAIQMFGSLVENNVLPSALTTQLGDVSSLLPHIDACVRAAYAGEDPSTPKPAQPSKKRKKAEEPEMPSSKVARKGGGPRQPGLPPSQMQMQNGGAWGQKGKGGGKGKRGGGRGHPRCVQGKQCCGSYEDCLYRHMDGDVRGDMYCQACWEQFYDADNTLEADFLRRHEMW